MSNLFSPVVSENAGCDYCVAAHSLLGKLAGLKPEVLKQIRAGQPTGGAAEAALARDGQHRTQVIPCKRGCAFLQTWFAHI